MGTVDPSGLAAEFSSQPALGSMVHTISAARWIITLTHTMAIVVHFRNAATSFLITLRKRSAGWTRARVRWRASLETTAV